MWKIQIRITNYYFEYYSPFAFYESIPRHYPRGRWCLPFSPMFSTKFLLSFLFFLSLSLSSNKREKSSRGFSLQFHTINFPYAIRVVRPRKINLTWRLGISSRLVKNGNYRHFKKLISQSVWNRVEKVGGIWPGTRSSAKSTGSNEFLLSSSSFRLFLPSMNSSSKNRGYAVQRIIDIRGWMKTISKMAINARHYQFLVWSVQFDAATGVRNWDDVLLGTRRRIRVSVI